MDRPREGQSHNRSPNPRRQKTLQKATFHEWECLLADWRLRIAARCYAADAGPPQTGSGISEIQSYRNVWGSRYRDYAHSLDRLWNGYVYMVFGYCTFAWIPCSYRHVVSTSTFTDILAVADPGLAVSFRLCHRLHVNSHLHRLGTTYCIVFWIIFPLAISPTRRCQLSLN